MPGCGEGSSRRRVTCRCSTQRELTRQRGRARDAGRGNSRAVAVIGDIFARGHVCAKGFKKDCFMPLISPGPATSFRHGCSRTRGRRVSTCIYGTRRSQHMARRLLALHTHSMQDDSFIPSDSWFDDRHSAHSQCMTTRTCIFFKL